MGTKNNPGAYDCYANLEPDEPYFLLKSTDETAPYLVAAWAAVRADDLAGAIRAVLLAHEARFAERGEPGANQPQSYQSPKLMEAVACSRAMSEWWLARRMDKLEEAARVRAHLGG